MNYYLEMKSNFWGYFDPENAFFLQNLLNINGDLQGPTWDGSSGVHTHMTNTRITDVEIVERRYPVHVKTFTLRPNSGGNGTFKGGDGVIRELMFRAPLTLSVLTERRVLQPYGLEGRGPKLVFLPR